MDTFTSTDGTPIGYVRSGSGPSLVLVHGGTADHTRWAPVLRALAERFSVYALDRRGRGGSGDSPDYRVEREFEDVACAVDSVEKPVYLLGHSFGALCSLEAALLTPNISRLVLYEPPEPGIPGMFPPALKAQMQALLDSGDRAGVISTFMREIAHVTPEELEILKASPSWDGRVAAAHTILREVTALETKPAFDPSRFESVKTPTLLLLGGDSPEPVHAFTETLHRSLANSRIAVLPGQQHVAMNTAPELFLKEVVGFLLAEPEEVQAS